MIFLDNLVADPRLAVVEAFDMPERDDIHQVPVSLDVLCQKDEVVICPVLVVLEFRVVVPCDIHLAPDDGLDLIFFSLLVPVLVGEFEELLYTVHIAVVGNGQGGHAHGLCPVKQGRYRRETVEDGVLRVDVKMNKGHNAGISLTNIPNC